jgi:NMD protein affecting ribosome stability and mRNA decay
MSTRSIPPGFHPIRSTHLLQEQVHDAYKIKGKLAEPTACPQCGAVFLSGRWQWNKAPANAHQHTCPACQRIHDHFPAGFVTLDGSFYTSHRDEIMHLISNEEKREKADHPLQRIMATEEIDGALHVTTTDIHLARRIGEALHHAYQGTLDYHYNPEQNLLRVSWTH